MAVFQGGAVQGLDQPWRPVVRHLDDGRRAAQVDAADAAAVDASGGAKEVQEFALGEAAREGFDTMKSAAVGAAVGSIGGVPGAAVGAVIGVLWSAIGKNLFANCDGPIAADSVHVSGATLNDQTGSGRHSETKNYPGVDSPGACGDNSNYDVTWSIGRA